MTKAVKPEKIYFILALFSCCLWQISSLQAAQNENTAVQIPVKQAKPLTPEEKMEKAAKLQEPPEARKAKAMVPRVEYNAQGLRDPFRNPKKIVEQAAREQVQAMPKLEVQGIVWGGAFPQAIINNKIVKVGDTLEGAQIIDINKDQITVFFAGQQHKIYSPAMNNLKKESSVSENKGGQK